MTGDGDGRIVVEGRTATGTVTWTERVRFPERERRNSFVARLWAAQRAGWLVRGTTPERASPELDGELRELGTRYGIPTELSSYLVLEPGMQVAGARQVGAAPAPVTVSAMGSARPDTSTVTVFRGEGGRATIGPEWRPRNAAAAPASAPAGANRSSDSRLRKPQQRSEPRRPCRPSTPTAQVSLAQPVRGSVRERSR